jgi:hypothetical protein
MAGDSHSMRFRVNLAKQPLAQEVEEVNTVAHVTLRA